MNTFERKKSKFRSSMASSWWCLVDNWKQTEYGFESLKMCEVKGDKDGPWVNLPLENKGRINDVKIDFH